MSCWQYITVRPMPHYMSEDELNDYGREGWELVAATPGVSYIFKRQIESKPA